VRSLATRGDIATDDIAELTETCHGAHGFTELRGSAPPNGACDARGAMSSASPGRVAARSTRATGLGSQRSARNTLDRPDAPRATR
jgi:hypothetical protein